jgi:hypothetical protein
MKCDSRVSLLAYTFASPCLACEPRVRVTTYKVVKLFHTMAIVSLNMGSLTLEVNIIKNKLVMGGERKAMLHEELDKERDFQKRYKRNVEIWKQNRIEVE